MKLLAEKEKEAVSEILSVILLLEECFRVGFFFHLREK